MSKGKRKKFGMQSIKFFLATLLQEVSSALFLMEFSAIASAINSCFASIGKQLADKITKIWSYQLG